MPDHRPIFPQVACIVTWLLWTCVTAVLTVSALEQPGGICGVVAPVWLLVSLAVGVHPRRFAEWAVLFAYASIAMTIWENRSLAWLGWPFGFVCAAGLVAAIKRSFSIVDQPTWMECIALAVSLAFIWGLFAPLSISHVPARIGVVESDFAFKYPFDAACSLFIGSLVISISTRADSSLGAP